VTRSASKRLTHPRFVLFGPGLFALGLLLFTLVGCSDDTPRAGSIDLAASTKAAADRGSIGVPVIAPKTRDGSRTRPRTKWKIGRTLNPTSETPVKTR
jgi:hypothetical protein